MATVTFYPAGHISDSRLVYAVIAARYEDQWIFCRHKDRQTWEIPGGHREAGECIEEAAGTVTPARIACSAAIFTKPFKAAHHLISLGLRVLVGIELLFKGETDKAGVLTEARANKVGRKVEISLLTRKGIESDKRLEYRAGIHRTKSVAGIEDALLPPALSDVSDNIVGVFF